MTLMACSPPNLGRWRVCILRDQSNVPDPKNAVCQSQFSAITTVKAFLRPQVVARYCAGSYQSIITATITREGFPYPSNLENSRLGIIQIVSDVTYWCAVRFVKAQSPSRGLFSQECNPLGWRSRGAKGTNCS